MAQSRPASLDFTIKDFFEKLYHYRNDREALSLFIKNCHTANVCDLFKNSKEPAHIIWHAILTNDISRLDLKSLKNAYDIINKSTDKTLLFQSTDPNKCLGPIDPSDIIALIKLVLEAIILIMQYLQTTGICNKKDATQTLIEILKLTANQQNPNIFINLAGANIHDVNLGNINLRGANLARTKWKNVFVFNANFDEANLEHVVFKNVDAGQATFKNANVDWADFSDSIVDKDAFGELSVNRILRTQFPFNFTLKRVVSNDELVYALNNLETELDYKKVKTQKNCPWLAIANKIERSTAHHIVARNISTLSDSITDPVQQATFLQTALDHPFYTKHVSARFAKAVNKIFVGIHDLFSQRRLNAPIVGNYSQNILLHKLRLVQKNIPQQQHAIKPQ